MTLQFSMGEYISRRYRQTNRKYTFAAAGYEEWRAWKSEFTGQIRELLAEWPEEKSDLQPVVLERTEADGYVIEKIVIQSEPGMKVPFYLLIPSERPARNLPAVLCLHGHGPGKDGVLGIDHGEKDKEIAIREVNYDIAPKLAKAGYVVLAPDARGFGERAWGYGNRGGTKDGCDTVFLKALLLGLNPLTLNIWDAMRCIDYLQTRPEADPERIGCVGLSFGGTWTLFTTLFEPRIKAAAVCGYLNLFGEFALHQGNFCGSQMIPGLLKYGEMGDVAGLLAPKPVLFSHGLHDIGFPVEQTRIAFETVAKAYETAGCPERTRLALFEGGHEFHPPEILAWMAEWL